MVETDFAETGTKFGITPAAIVELGALMHDLAIGCEAHYWPRRAEDGFSIERVHQRHALVLLREMSRRMTHLRIDATRQ